MNRAISNHFDGEKFSNLGEPPQRDLWDVLRWKLTSRAARWPERVEFPPQMPPDAPQPEGAAVTWIGHATFLVQTQQGNFLTDPVYSERIGPFRWAGPRRVIAPGISWERLPKIDAVLLSHDHYDHCDMPTLRRLAHDAAATIVAPLGHAALLSGSGLTAPVVDLDWWETHRLAGGAAVTLVPARHWCRRRPGDTNKRLWGGFILTAGRRQIYFAGDSGYDESLFSEIGRRTGRPDLALIPIGAYEPRWFMREAHMNPAEAVRVHRDVGARQSVAMHWGTFQLTDEAREDPVRELAAAKAKAEISEGAFTVLAPGGSLLV